ncbi:hypothetical protein N9V13_01445 [Betaproteobacteria bacterium]|nr:hypothetical protein [Betaproteobacteria bacterium]
MQKFDPELGQPSERVRDMKGEELLAFLEEDKRNTIVCCNNLFLLNKLASSLKKSLVKKNPTAVFYGNNELEKFIADSLVDNYGEAFSDLVGNYEEHNEADRNAKTILMLKNGEKLDENEIAILRSLSEKAEPEKNKMILFFNIGISSKKVKQKIDTFGNTFFLYDAQDIEIREDTDDVSLSRTNDLKKPIDQTVEDIPSDKKEVEVSTETEKNRSKKIKIIFVLLLAVGFIFSLEEKVQTKILQIINASSSGKVFFPIAGDCLKRNFYSSAKNKFPVIYLSGYRGDRDSYVS